MAVNIRKLKGKHLRYQNTNHDSKIRVTGGIDLKRFRKNFDKMDMAGKSIMEAEMERREREELWAEMDQTKPRDFIVKQKRIMGTAIRG